MQNHRPAFREPNLRSIITQMCAENTQRLIKQASKNQQIRKNNIPLDDSFSILENINPNLIRSETFDILNAINYDSILTDWNILFREEDAGKTSKWIPCE